MFRESFFTRHKAAVAFLLIGIFISFYPLIFSGFSLMLGDRGDARFVNYILEHTYRWVIQLKGHEALWSPPVFYPAKDTAAYSDIMLGVAPFYWFLRALSFSPKTAFQVWQLSMASLNFIVAYLLLKRLWTFKSLSASAGAFLFAFGSIRTAQLSHLQLLPQFYSLLCLAFIWLFFRTLKSSSSGKLYTYLTLIALSFSLQLYASFYYAWILTLVVFLGVLISLFFSDTREIIILALRSRWQALISTAFLVLLCSLPVLLPYLKAASEVGYRDFSEVKLFIPALKSYLYLGEESWLYGGMAKLNYFADLDFVVEKKLGLGFLTLVFTLTGFLLRIRQRESKVILLVSSLLIVLSSFFWSDFTLWEYLYKYLPGAGAVRAVSRVGIFLLIPGAIGVAFFFEHCATQYKKEKLSFTVLFLLLSLLVLEQGRGLSTYSKEQVAATVKQLVTAIKTNPEQCKEAFIFAQFNGSYPSWQYQIDAMWASLETGLPTVNGYSGNNPPGWDVAEANIRTKKKKMRFARRARQWLEDNKRNPKDICWLKRIGQKQIEVRVARCCSGRSAPASKRIKAE